MRLRDILESRPESDYRPATPRTNRNGTGVGYILAMALTLGAIASCSTYKTQRQSLDPVYKVFVSRR